MRRSVLYSPSARPGPAADGARVAPEAPATGASPAAAPGHWRQMLARAAVNPRAMWAALALLGALLLASLWQQTRAGARALTQQDIDAAVLHTLNTQNLPSPTARAAEKVRPSVVRVVAFARDRQGREVEAGVGTGLVIVDKGVILTNLHVVDTARRLRHQALAIHRALVVRRRRLRDVRVRVAREEVHVVAVRRAPVRVVRVVRARAPLRP